VRVLALTHVFPRAVDDPSAPFLLTWARALREAGVELGVVAPHDAGLPERHTVGGVPVRLVRYAPESAETVAYRGEMHQLVRNAAGAVALAGLLAAMAVSVRLQAGHGRADVVHVHWWVPGAVMARLARPPAPVVCTVHGTDVGLLEGRPRLASLARWALAGCDRIEAVSAALADRLEAATGVRADAVNPMPLASLAADPAPAASEPASAEHAAKPASADQAATPRPAPEASGRARDCFHIVAVGRMVPEKGFGELLAAAAQLDQPVRVTLIGDGPEQSRLRAEATRLGLELALPGRVDPAELSAHYRGADVVAQPSHREGFGLVAAEALLAGTPVVATDSGGVREVLDAEELVGVGDVEALAAALARVAAAPAGARRSAARHAERLRARLSPSAAAERTLAGYRAVLSGG
jgi:glycosyltransferase involved in cell wall biosynthesis